MSRRIEQVGFSQRVRLEWLEQTASLVLAGNDKAGVNQALQTILKDKVSIGGKAERGNREKIITILMQLWVASPRDLESLRIHGLELLKDVPRPDRTAIHWGMVMAVYPFWAAVARQVGRLLRLQGVAAGAQVQRRIREQYGERETVSRAARRVLRSFVDWGVLRESGSRGIYIQGMSTAIEDPHVVCWLIEASLHARANSRAPVRELVENPSLFPFKLKLMTPHQSLSASPRLEYVRSGLDEDLVMLRTRCDAKSPDGHLDSPGGHREFPHPRSKLRFR